MGNFWKPACTESESCAICLVSSIIGSIRDESIGTGVETGDAGIVEDAGETEITAPEFVNVDRGITEVTRIDFPSLIAHSFS
jgi:hypothetical protein